MKNDSHTHYITESCCSVAKLCPALWDSLDYSTAGFSVLHCLPEFAQTHVHWVDDTTQPSHSLSPASPPVLNLSKYQGLFQWVSSLQQVAKVVELLREHRDYYYYFFFKFYFIFKLYIIVLVLPNIKMNPPQVYMCSPSWLNSHG